jgi:diguanylate cyclase (GGDEF)-like protein
VERTRLAVLAGGFLAILLVIAAVIGISLHSMSQTRNSLDRLANLLQRKMVEVATMREHLYLRIVSSRDMMLMTDAFDIDAEAQKFRVYPARIEAAYKRFRELADDPQEIALVEKFMVEAQLGLPLVNAAVDQLIAGKRSEEIVPLLTKAFETQKLGLETLLTLQDYLQGKSVKLAQEAVDRYEDTRWLIVSLTALAVLLVLGISAVVAVLLEQHTAELDREHRKFKTLFETSRDAVLILADGAITECNRRALEWFDPRGSGELTGLRLDDLSPPAEGGENATARLRDAMTSENGGTFEWLFRDRQGNPLHGEVTLIPLTGSSPRQHQLVIRDVTARILELRRMSHEAMHDPLTGLPNRREFERRAELAVGNARRDGSAHVFCYLDLDNFKPVNDTAGHAAGDELLRQVSSLLRSRIRTGDLLARIGGDEFGLLLENCSLEHGSTIARSIIQGVSEMPFSAAARVFRIGISIGLVPITRDAPALDTLMAAADQACYTAKRDNAHLVIATAAGNPPTGIP